MSSVRIGRTLLALEALSKNVIVRELSSSEEKYADMMIRHHPFVDLGSPSKIYRANATSLATEKDSEENLVSTTATEAAKTSSRSSGRNA